MHITIISNIHLLCVSFFAIGYNCNHTSGTADTIDGKRGEAIIQNHHLWDLNIDRTLDERFLNNKNAYCKK